MRISRIRDFTNSTEITLVLEGNDAQALCHAIECKKCENPKRKKLGLELLKQFNLLIFTKAWKVWKD